MNKAIYEIIQRLEMSYHPILGTTYNLIEITQEKDYSESEGPTFEYNNSMRHILSRVKEIQEVKECSHGKSSIQMIGNRSYCDICQKYVYNAID